MALTMPAGLSTDGRKAWREGREALVEMGEEPELSRGSLERYARACGLAAELERSWRKAGSPATVEGVHSAQAHPQLESIRKAWAQAHELGTALGLNPVGRRMLARSVGAGRPQGAASAPDRAAPPRRRLRSVAQ